MRRFFVLASLLVVLSSLWACKEEILPEKKVEKRFYPGDVQVLNSCGIDNAASKMKNYLRSQGFDVVVVSNDRLRNYEETILVIHTPGWEGEKPLAKALKTNNVLHVQNNRAYVDASVYIGRDLEQIIQQDSL